MLILLLIIGLLFFGSMFSSLFSLYLIARNASIYQFLCYVCLFLFGYFCAGDTGGLTKLIYCLISSSFMIFYLAVKIILDDVKNWSTAVHQ